MTRAPSQRKPANRIEAARDVADDECLDLGHAAALLAMLGEHIGEPGRRSDDRELQDLGSRVEYLARQIMRHKDRLSTALQKIERAPWQCADQARTVATWTKAATLSPFALAALPTTRQPK